MKVVTYTCDRCHATDQTNSIDLTPIQIQVFSFKSVVKSADWCRNCLNITGLLSYTDPVLEVEKIVPPPSMEDIIREIIREERRNNLESI
mgnify:CR=1 FL=1